MPESLYTTKDLRIASYLRMRGFAVSVRAVDAATVVFTTDATPAALDAVHEWTEGRATLTRLPFDRARGSLRAEARRLVGQVTGVEDAPRS